MGELILKGTQLSKQFYGNTVLDGVSIALRTHNVLALVGENGAGKSTLMNIISGGLAPDGGTMELDGKPVVFKNSHDAQVQGISFVHQELSLLEDLTVGENIMLGLEPRRGPFIHMGELNRLAGAVLGELDYEIDVHRMVCDLSPAEKQITEIAKAWVTKPRILILDEPTSSLNKVESDKLFRFVAKAKEQGVSVVLITHRMDEIFQICDEANVLRDGEMTASEPIENLTTDILISKMVGREVKNTFPPRCDKLGDELALELQDACVAGAVRDVNLRAPKGCILGIGGLEGQGQRQLARALFGVEPFTGGQFKISDQPVTIKSPAHALRHRIGFVPDDRKNEGLALPLSIEENMTLLILRQIAEGGFVRRGKVNAAAEEGVKLLNIRMASPRQPVINLSGGNQQKVIFSKWVAAKPDILVLHEPTRGVDVQSKLEIYELIRRLTNSGVSVLLFSSDMLELIGMSDVIHVMYGGTITGSMPGAEATEEKLMALASGLPQGKEAAPCRDQSKNN